MMYESILLALLDELLRYKAVLKGRRNLSASQCPKSVAGKLLCLIRNRHQEFEGSAPNRNARLRDIRALISHSVPAIVPR